MGIRCSKKSSHQINFLLTLIQLFFTSRLFFGLYLYSVCVSCTRRVYEDKVIGSVVTLILRMQRLLLYEFFSVSSPVKESIIVYCIYIFSIDFTCINSSCASFTFSFEFPNLFYLFLN